MLEFNKINYMTGTLTSLLRLWQTDFSIRIKKIDNKKSDNTVDIYVKNIGYLIEYIENDDEVANEYKKLEDIDSDLINMYLKDRAKNSKTKKDDISYWTKYNDKKILKIFFDYIEDRIQGKIDRNFAFYRLKWNKVAIKNNRKEKPKYDKIEYETILAHLEKKIRNSRKEFDYMLSFAFKLCLYGGLRATEVCNLTFDNFKNIRATKNKNKVIDLLVHGKGSTIFTIPLPYEKIKKEYGYYKRNIPDNIKNKKFFKGKTGTNLTRYTFYRYLEEVTNELGIELSSIHSLRVTYANNILEKGTDISDLQHLMRHSDIKTTTVYTRKSDARLDDAVEKLLDL